MKEYNFIAGTLGLLMLCVALLSCSNDEVVTSTNYMDTPLNEIVWNSDGNNGGETNGVTTTAPCL